MQSVFYYCIVDSKQTESRNAQFCYFYVSTDVIPRWYKRKLIRKGGNCEKLLFCLRRPIPLALAEVQNLCTAHNICAWCLKKVVMWLAHSWQLEVTYYLSTICIFAGWEVSYRCRKAQCKAKLVGFQAETTASVKDVGLQISATRFMSLKMQADSHR